MIYTNAPNTTGPPLRDSSSAMLGIILASDYGYFLQTFPSKILYEILVPDPLMARILLMQKVCLRNSSTRFPYGTDLANAKSVPTQFSYENPLLEPPTKFSYKQF